MKEQKRQDAWQGVALALQGASDSINASNAGYSTTSGTTSTSAYGSNGNWANANSTYNSTTYDQGKVLAAQQKARSEQQRKAERIDRNRIRILVC